MPRAPLITTSFASPTLVPQVLGNATFAQRGYLWGSDGTVHYCFFNPDKIRFEIWKKKWHLLPFLVPAAFLVLSIFVHAALIASFLTVFVPFLLYKHYYTTAEEQLAAAVTNGPQMKLPFNMQFGTVLGLSMFLLAAPTLAGGILGGLFGTAIPIPVVGSLGGWAWGALIGLLTGLNLVALFLFLLGMFATPFGAVITPTFSENVPFELFTFYFGRSATAFGSYAVGPNNPPPALTWASGGLMPMVIGGKTASFSSVPQIAKSYDDLVANPRPEVVWALIPFGADPKQEIREGFAAQESIYQGKHPAGIVLIAGSEAWNNGCTNNLIKHGTTAAAATDGSQSALLGGSKGDFVVGGAGGIFNLSSYRDPIQRYGFMAVPE